MVGVWNRLTVSPSVVLTRRDHYVSAAITINSANRTVYAEGNVNLRGADSVLGAAPPGGG